MFALTAMLLGAAGSGALAAGAHARSASGGDLAQRLVAICEEALAGDAIDELAARVELGGEVVLAREWRRSDPRQRRRDAPSVVRDAAALFEPLIGVALLSLDERGAISLDDSASKYVPELSVEKRGIRVVHLLEHTSGLARYRDAPDAPRGAGADSLARWIAARPLESEPGACSAYSESDTLLAALVVERVSKRDLADWLAERVLEPAGMDSTDLAQRPRAVGEAASIDVGGMRLEIAPPARELGIGAVASTAGDMALFVRAIAARELVGEAAVERLVRVPTLPDGSEVAHAFGFARSRIDRREHLAFGGASAGACYRVAWVPDVALTISLAARGEGADLARLDRRLASAVVEAPAAEILDLPLDAGARAVYSGGYYIGCSRLAIEERGEALWLAAPWDEPFRLRFQGADRFVSAADDGVWLDFRVEEGRATAFVLSIHGSQSLARRVE